MEPITLLVVVGVVVVWLLVRGKEKAGEAKVEEMMDLRYRTLDEDKNDPVEMTVFADLKQMLLVTESGERDFHVTQVDHLRRREGPIWESTEEDASRKRKLARLDKQDKTSPLFSPKEYEEELAEVRDRSWRPADYPTLEVAYQRFIAHYKDDGSTWDRVALAVKQDEEHWSNKPKTSESP